MTEVLGNPPPTQTTTTTTSSSSPPTTPIPSSIFTPQDILNACKSIQQSDGGTSVILCDNEANVEDNDDDVDAHVNRDDDDILSSLNDQLNDEAHNDNEDDEVRNFFF